MNINLSIRFFLTISILLLCILSTLACNSAEEPESVPESRLTLMENRLKQLEAREDISRLLMDYGRFLDQRDFESFSMLFAEENGEWIGGMGRAKSRSAIRELMEEKIGSNAGESSASNFHLFMNESIDVDGDSARATSKWTFMIQGEDDRPHPFLLGHYEDLFVREKGEWKFLKRVVYSDIPKDNPEP